MATEFSKKTLDELDNILNRYPTKQAASLPALYLAQRDFGHISDDIVGYIAGLLELAPAEIHDVVSFYSMFYRKEMGKHVIQVCHTLSCSLLGASWVVECIEQKLGIHPGETTPDKKFSFIKVECLGSCGTAPVVRINDDYYENITREKLDTLIDDLSK